MTDDDESKPMTRTELAMLWDLLGMWIYSRQELPGFALIASAELLRVNIDAELAERFGG
jgi:hypothetical protein